jgi:hypothetical protein
VKISKELVKKAIAVEMEKRNAAELKSHREPVTGITENLVVNQDGVVAAVLTEKPQRRKYDRFKHRGRGVK